MHLGRFCAPGRVLVLCLATLVAVAGPGAVRANHPDHGHEHEQRPGEHHDEHDHEAPTLPHHMQQVFLDQLPPEPLVRLTSTPCSNGSAAGYPCLNVDLVAFLPLANIGGGSGNDCWGWTDPLTGRKYALMGRSSGTSFVDITDPTPVYLGNLPTHTVNSAWRDIKTYADHAFIVSEASGHGMQVFDLRQLRNVANPPVTFGATTHYPNFGNAHNIAINEDTGFAYAVGTGTCSGGLHMVNIQTPAAPLFAGCVSNDGYTHDTQCVVYHGPDAAHVGREICFSSNEDTVTIVDVTSKSAPVQLSRTAYTGRGYTHQGWLTPDHRWFLFDDELDEQQFGHNTRTRVFDVANLDAPLFVGGYDGTTPAIDHNLYVHAGRAYAANYRAGLRILDISNVAQVQLPEVGHFDIYPSSNSPNFNGAWSNYPYFDDGIVIVSGIEQGLFVLRTTLDADFVLDATADTLELCLPGTATAELNVASLNSYGGAVTLSAQSLPSGASASFAPNPVAAPGSSVLTLEAEALGWGEYTFTVRGTDGTLTHALDLDLVVAGEPPEAVALVAPADGTSDAPRQPGLSWSAAFPVTSYLLEIATDPGFANVVYTANVVQTTHTPTAPLAFGTTHYWRVTALNPCGAGAASPPFSFVTLAAPAILVVDDDDNTPNVRSYYTSTLDGIPASFHVWDTNGTDSEPDAATLGAYSTVIWITGDAQSAASGPSAASEAALAGWLDRSGCLVVASQDYVQVRGLTPFAQSYLGVAAVTNDVAHQSVKGRGAFSGLGPFALSFPYTNRTDAPQPAAGAEVACDGSAGNAALIKDGAWYRTTYLGFGLETLPSAGEREAFLERVLDWCDGLAVLDGDGDGTTNAEDCLASDPLLWSAPSPALELRLAKSPSGNLGWLAPAAPGAAAVTYDVLRSLDPASFALADCVESADVDTTATELLDPAAGELQAYLVRVVNGCGASLGTRSDGTPRTAPACP